MPTPNIYIYNVCIQPSRMSFEMYELHFKYIQIENGYLSCNNITIS